MVSLEEGLVPSCLFAHDRLRINTYLTGSETYYVVFFPLSSDPTNKPGQETEDEDNM